MATSYFRERARNPHLLDASDEEAQGLATAPTFSRAMPMAPEVVENPPLRAYEMKPRAVTPGATVPAAFSTIDPITAGAEAYMADAPTTTGGKFKDVLKSAALGFLTGASRNAENPLLAGVGGAATGGALQAISPSTGRAFQFETIERPRIEDQQRREQERLKRQQEQEDRQRAIELDGLKREDIRAGINLQNAQAKKALTPDIPRAVAPELKLGRNRKTGLTTYYNALDPAANAAFEPIADSPYRASSLGVLDTRTGEITTPAPEKNADPPRQAFEDLNGLSRLKEEAEETWRQWSAPELAEGESDTPAAKEQRRIQAVAAQERFNQAVANFGSVYGRWFETGAGAGGWGYIKPRPAQQAPSRAKSPQSGQPTANLGELEELWNRQPPKRR